MTAVGSDGFDAGDEVVAIAGVDRLVAGCIDQRGFIEPGVVGQAGVFAAIVGDGADAAYRERRPGQFVFPGQVLTEAVVVGVAGQQVGCIRITALVVLRVDLFDQVEAGVGALQYTLCIA